MWCSVRSLCNEHRRRRTVHASANFVTSAGKCIKICRERSKWVRKKKRKCVILNNKNSNKWEKWGEKLRKIIFIIYNGDSRRVSRERVTFCERVSSRRLFCQDRQGSATNKWGVLRSVASVLSGDFGKDPLVKWRKGAKFGRKCL